MHPRGGRDRNGVVFVDKVAVVGVAPLRPSSKFGEMLSNLSENSLPIQSVEGIFEINLKQDLIFASITSAPLPNDMDSDLGTKGGAAAHLKRP